MNYVIYKRLSRDSKTGGNLGLDAQQHSIDGFLRSKPNHKVLASFTEIESGTRKGNKRPELKKALALCKEQQATLVITTISRLARNVHFISGLIESNVEFTAIDMPVFNKTMIFVAAAFAEQEADFISARTKAALQELKKKGKQLGAKGYQNLCCPQAKEALEAYHKNRKQHSADFADKIFPTVSFYKSQGLNNLRVARELNKKGFATPSGRGTWHSQTVSRCIRVVTGGGN